ncbi:MAG: YceI family protein [Bdellovibrionales bacterium]
MKNASIENGKGIIVADMNSIDETTLNGEMKSKFLTHIKSADFFEVKKYPTAQLAIEKLENGHLYGKLTIKGKTQDVTIPYKKSANTYSGTLSFDRTKFGIIYGSGNFFKNLGDKVIADTITLNFKVVTH